MDKRELAWKCWSEILHKFEEIEYYRLHNGNSGIKKGCGGDIINIIVKYL